MTKAWGAGRKRRAEKLRKLRAHPYCRPPRGASDVLRLGDDNQWRPDNGMPGRAFVGLNVAQVCPRYGNQDQNISSPVVWVAFCKCKIYANCPASKAADKACDHFGSCVIHRRRGVSRARTQKGRAFAARRELARRRS